MPRTHLTDKYCKPKVPPPNYLSELLKRYKKAQTITDDQLAEKFRTCRKTVNSRLNQNADDWNIGELRRYCEALNVPFSDAMAAVQGIQK